MLVVVLIVAPFQDAMFGLVLVGNAAIGIIQELRAKQTLDRLALLSAPRATVIRNGQEAEVPVDRVVLDDLLTLRAGEQIVVDGVVVDSESLEVDESLLTGESDAILKERGDEVLSGSFVSSGSGVYKARRVGADAYAARLAEEARKFTLVRSRTAIRHRQDPQGASPGCWCPPPCCSSGASSPPSPDGPTTRRGDGPTSRRPSGSRSPAWWR